MTTVLALPLLYNAVVAQFAADAGQVSILETYAFTGTSAPAITGVPTAATQVRIRFVAGGTVGIAGITYQVSTDDGTTYGAVTPLGTSTTIVVAGIMLTLGVGTVVDGDALRWTTTDPTIPPQSFGWREPPHRTGTMRIVWVPGDDGNAGELVVGIRNPGRNPRMLATLAELATIYVEAVDLTAPENELAQYTAARLLFDAWMRAVYLAAHGTFEIRAVRWVNDKNVRRYGATMRVVIAIQSMVPDQPFAQAPADASAVVTTSVLDVDDVDTVSPS